MHYNRAVLGLNVIAVAKTVWSTYTFLFFPQFFPGGGGAVYFFIFYFLMSFILEHWQSFIYLFLLLLLPTPHASFQEVMCLETTEAVTTP